MTGAWPLGALKRTSGGQVCLQLLDHGPSSSFRSLLVGAVGAWLLRESQRDAIFVFMGGFDHFDVSLNSAIAWQMPN
jgi:hypothetical protein